MRRLDEALVTLLRQPVKTVGAGLPDTGINARCQAARFNLDTMNRAAERLLHYDDFTTFAKLDSNNRTVIKCPAND